MPKRMGWVLELDGGSVRFRRRDDGSLQMDTRNPDRRWVISHVFRPRSGVDRMYLHCHQMTETVEELRKTNQSQAAHITDLSALLVRHDLWPG